MGIEDDSGGAIRDVARERLQQQLDEVDGDDEYRTLVREELQRTLKAIDDDEYWRLLRERDRLQQELDDRNHSDNSPVAWAFGLLTLGAAIFVIGWIAHDLLA